MSILKFKGIISYPNVFIPKAIKQGDDPKYTTSLLILKTDPQIQVIGAAIETAKLNGFPSGFPASGGTCLHDGQLKFPEEPKLHPYMILTAASNVQSKPLVVDANLAPIIDPGQVYPGAEVWLSVNFYTYDKSVSKGVTAGLNGVMVTGLEGALGRLDNRPTVEQMFGPETTATTATPAASTQPVVTHTPAPNAAPAPNATPAPAPNAAPQYIMTAAADGFTRDQLLDNGKGWTDDLLVLQGMMIKPSFA